MNITSINVDTGESEFKFVDVDSCSSYKVLSLSVKESPIRYESTLKDAISINDLLIGGTVILLDRKFIYVQDHLYKNRK
jgi:flavin reductase (DIM6/NTAB) family NADH-FMN oxidoreductase RutF